MDKDDCIAEIDTVRRLRDETYSWLCTFENDEFNRLRYHGSDEEFKEYNGMNSDERAKWCFRKYNTYKEKFLMFCALSEFLKII